MYHKYLTNIIANTRTLTCYRNKSGREPDKSHKAGSCTPFETTQAMVFAIRGGVAPPYRFSVHCSIRDVENRLSVDSLCRIMSLIFVSKARLQTVLALIRNVSITS